VSAFILTTNRAERQGIVDRIGATWPFVLCWRPFRENEEAELIFMARVEVWEWAMGTRLPQSAHDWQKIA
jgi:hypothetical protein